MSDTKTIITPVDKTDDATGLDGPCQVILFNDDHTPADFVVQCLMRIFRHGGQVAIKIMMEAHTRGRAIAEVEDGAKAQMHKDQLVSCGLTAAVEKI